MLIKQLLKLYKKLLELRDLGQHLPYTLFRLLLVQIADIFGNMLAPELFNFDVEVAILFYNLIIAELT